MRAIKIFIIIMTSIFIRCTGATLTIINDNGFPEKIALLDPRLSQKQIILHPGQKHSFTIPDMIPNIRVGWTTHYTYSWPVFDYIWAREGGDPYYGNYQEYIAYETNVPLLDKKSKTVTLKKYKQTINPEQKWPEYAERKSLQDGDTILDAQEIQRVKELSQVTFKK